MTPLFIEGWAVWPAAGDGGRPAPTLLGANERRRAPDGVLAALAVAEAAVADAGRAAEDVPSVFASTHGDLAIVDALCATLAADPLLLSPTRFHHSVHNAPSGYWAIGTHNSNASTATAGGRFTFGSAWLEAACQCAADDRAVLLAACDTDARGALAGVNTSRGLLAVALVLAPERSARSRWAVNAQLQPVPAPESAPPPPAALAANAMAPAFPLVAALRAGRSTTVQLGLGEALSLALTLQPLSPVPSGA